MMNLPRVEFLIQCFAAGLPTLLLQPMKLCLLSKAHQETWGEVGRSGEKRGEVGRSGSMAKCCGGTNSAEAARKDWVQVETVKRKVLLSQVPCADTLSASISSADFPIKCLFMGDGPTPPR